MEEQKPLFCGICGSILRKGGKCTGSHTKKAKKLPLKKVSNRVIGILQAISNAKKPMCEENGGKICTDGLQCPYEWYCEQLDLSTTSLKLLREQMKANNYQL